MLSFWSKVERGAADECWPWRGSLGLGYGLWSIRRGDAAKRTERAHRVAWELANLQPAPSGMEVMHTCDKPSCVLPSHLQLGTHAENMRDRDRKGRRAEVARVGGPIRLTAAKVVEIRARRAAGESTESLGAAFGVTPMSIDNCVSRRSWRHVA